MYKLHTARLAAEFRKCRRGSSQGRSKMCVSSQGPTVTGTVSSAAEHPWGGKPRASLLCHTWPAPTHAVGEDEREMSTTVLHDNMNMSDLLYIFTWRAAVHKHHNNLQHFPITDAS